MTSLARDKAQAMAKILDLPMESLPELELKFWRAGLNGELNLGGGGNAELPYPVDEKATGETIPVRRPKGQLAVGDPTAASDAATRKYVDARVQQEGEDRMATMEGLLDLIYDLEERVSKLEK